MNDKLTDFVEARVNEDTSDDATAKRRLFQDITEGFSHEHWGDDGLMAELRETLLADLAAFYADHPGYDERWRP